MAASMIEASSGHTLPLHLPPDWTYDLATFLDLDMAVLGADPAEYDAYEAGIAAEYVPVHGTDVFRGGRAAFLKAALARDRLFLTEAFHAPLDAQARANLARALECSADDIAAAKTLAFSPSPVLHG